MTHTLHTLILAHRCRSTHHYIVMDALERLSGPQAGDWRALMLHEHTALLAGAKAPDTEFKDFKNHVLHLDGEEEWGGARGAATQWYNTAVSALAQRKWREGAYALGVLSHYYADPLQPFHTGQTESEGAVHRALEWSIFRCRPALKSRMDAAGYPRLVPGRDSNFVSDMVREGAGRSNPHYDEFIDHYDLESGSKVPETGMDDRLLDITAGLLAHAVAGVAALFERAFAEAGVMPKPVTLQLDTFLAQLDIPLRKILAKIDDKKARQEVEAAYREFRATGKVINALSDDDAAIRALHAKERLGLNMAQLKAQPARKPGTRFGTRIDTSDRIEVAAPAMAVAAPEAPAAPALSAQPPQPLPARPAGRLTGDSDVIDAPSIGKRTARRLKAIGIATIDDLLAADPQATASRLGATHITAQTLADWQAQTRLKLALPSLRVHDVQLLVGADIRSPDDLARASARELLEAAMAFARTPQTQRIIAPENAPTPAEVADWIDLARAATA